MIECQKTFNPVKIQSLYSQSVYSTGNICDGVSSTYGYINGSTNSGIAMLMDYNFSGIPDKSTLISAIIGSPNCRWKVNKSYGYEYIWLHRIYYGNVYDEWAYDNSATRFVYYKSTRSDTVYSFTTSQYDLKSLSNKTALNMEKLLKNGVYSDGTVASFVSVSIAFKIDYSSSTNHYINMMPITIKYGVPEYNISYNLNGGSLTSGYNAVGSTGGNSQQLNPTRVTYDGTSGYDKLIKIETPTRSGYTFTGWTVTGMDTCNHVYLANSTTNTSTDTSWSGVTFNEMYNLTSVDGATVTFTANWTPAVSTISFNSNGGESYSSRQISTGQPYGTLPTPTKSGYDFLGWYKTNACCSGARYNGSTDFNVIGRGYMYTNNIAVHVEAYMQDWSQIASANGQILSCTEGGGWGIGYGANTDGHGTEVYTNGYTGINFGLQSLSSGWHTFDMVFNNGTFSGYVDGVLKDQKSTQANTITYNATNAIFVGAEAGSDSTTPADSFFNGIISDVLISNQGSKLTALTSSDTVTESCTLYAMWRLKDKINKLAAGGTKISAMHIGSSEVKEIYVGSTKVYG